MHNRLLWPQSYPERGPGLPPLAPRVPGVITAAMRERPGEKGRVRVSLPLVPFPCPMGAVCKEPARGAFPSHSSSWVSTPFLLPWTLTLRGGRRGCCCLHNSLTAKPAAQPLSNFLHNSKTFFRQGISLTNTSHSCRK